MPRQLTVDAYKSLHVESNQARDSQRFQRHGSVEMHDDEPEGYYGLARVRAANPNTEGSAGKKERSNLKEGLVLAGIRRKDASAKERGEEFSKSASWRGRGSERERGVGVE